MRDKSPSSSTTTTQVREIRRTAVEGLSAAEEKALRMRSGVGLDPEARLPRRGQKNLDAKAELLALEIELRQKLAEREGAAQPRAAAPVRTREKEKIIRALRRLK